MRTLLLHALYYEYFDKNTPRGCGYPAWLRTGRNTGDFTASIYKSLVIRQLRETASREANSLESFAMPDQRKKADTLIEKLALSWQAKLIVSRARAA